MIIKKEIREFAKIYKGKEGEGLAQWKNEQKEKLDKMDENHIINAKERALFEQSCVRDKLMYDKGFPGNNLLLQLVIIMSSVLASIVFCIMDMVGEIVKLFATVENFSQQETLDQFKALFDEYINGVLGIGGLVIKVCFVFLSIVFVFEVLVFGASKLRRKELIIEERFYTHLIELYEKK